MNPSAARTLWMVALADVIFLPVILYSFLEGRDQTSIVDRLLSITGTQAAGLLLFTVALGTKLRKKDTPFSVPLHRFTGLALVSLVIIHIILALITDPNNWTLLSFIYAPARGVAGAAAIICWISAIALGEFRRASRLDTRKWRLFHIGLAWMGAIFALAHILWIDQLVNRGVWLLLFAGMVITAIYLWFTRAKVVSKSNGPVPRIAKIALVLGALLAVLVTILAWRSPDSLNIGYVSNEYGPIGPADRDMLYKVKQAGLWETPIGDELAKRGSTEPVREIGRKINAEHIELDRIVTDGANQLGIPLPSEPTPDQQSWMEEIRSQPDGDKFDKSAVYFLRQAHGKVLPLLANVKVGTRNQVVRDVATGGMVFVSRHIGYLESTGLVNYSELPEPPPPSPYQQPAEASFFDSYDSRSLIISSALVVVLSVLFVSIVLAMIRSRPKKLKEIPRHRKVGNKNES